MSDEMTVPPARSFLIKGGAVITVDPEWAPRQRGTFLCVTARSLRSAMTLPYSGAQLIDAADMIGDAAFR